jgi:PAS domain S-box-containing protein
MTSKPTYEELEQRVKELEKGAAKRKEVEEALQEAEARYREIASSIPGVVYQFLLKKDGSYSSPYMSESASSILDISADEVKANSYSLFDRIVKEDLDPINQSIAESAQTMKTWLQEFRIRARTGEIRWMRATSTPHLLPNGEILWNGVILDISDLKRTQEALERAHDELERRVEQRTAELSKANKELQAEIAERKEAEEALRDSEEKYRELADLLPQTVFEIDERGNFTFANRYGFESSGYTREDIDKALNALGLFIPEDRERVAQNMRKILSGERSEGHEYTALRKNGSTFPVLIYSSPIVRDNKAVGLRGLVIDMTEYKLAEKALRESEEMYRRIVETAQEGIWMIDAEANTTYVNQRLVEMVGYTVKEMLGRSAFDFIDESKREEVERRIERRKRGSNLNEKMVQFCGRLSQLTRCLMMTANSSVISA